jgi:hypothetical protein
VVIGSVSASRLRLVRGVRFVHVRSGVGRASAA